MAKAVLTPKGDRYQPDPSVSIVTKLPNGTWGEITKERDGTWAQRAYDKDGKFLRRQAGLDEAAVRDFIAKAKASGLNPVGSAGGVSAGPAPAPGAGGGGGGGGAGKGR